MYDPSEWLHRLGESRPRDAAALTQDILDRVGPPPIPDRCPALAPDATTSVIAVQLIPLLADDLCRRAAARARKLRESGAGQAELDDAAAESRFWAHVRDWSRTWGQGKPMAYVPPQGRFGLIPRQTRRTV